MSIQRFLAGGGSASSLLGADFVEVNVRQTADAFQRLSMTVTKAE